MTTPAETKTGRERAKAAARWGAFLIVCPALLLFWVQSRWWGRNQALQSMSQAFALLPGLSGQYLRRAFLSRALKRCAASAVIEFGTVFSQADAEIEADAYIGPMCQIGLASIGAGALLAAGVHVPSGARTHGFADLDLPIRDQAAIRTLVRIGAGAWIGSAAVVMADVGAETVVGAGAVVTHPLPAGVVAVGVPARVLRSRATASDRL